MSIRHERLLVSNTDGVNFFDGVAVEGSWRIVEVGDNLVQQRYEGGGWVEKSASTP